jgi:hypothetical protein
MSSAGEPLPASVRRPAEASLGVPLSTIRLHRGRDAERAAARAGARGYQTGRDVVLGADAGPDTLAHELVHVAQAARMGRAAAGGRAVSTRDSPAEAEARGLASSVRRGVPVSVRAPADAHVHRDEPAKPAPVVLGPGNSLSGYPLLKTALDPGDFSKLSQAAFQRSQTITLGSASPKQTMTSMVTTPLRRLIRPSPAGAGADKGDAFLKDLYRMGLSGAGPAELGLRLQREIMGRWLANDAGILDEPVTISLADPEGKAGGAQAFLTFTVRGINIPTADGTLLAGAVDHALNDSMPGIASAVQAETSGLSAAIGAGSEARAALQKAKDVVAMSDRDLTTAQLDLAQKRLAAGIAALEGVKEEPFHSMNGDLLKECGQLQSAGLADRRAKHKDFQAKNPREKGSYEKGMERGQQMSKAADEARKEGGILNMYGAILFDQSAGMNYQGAVTQDMVTGGAGSTKQRLGALYDEGKISLNQYEEGAEAVTTRGNWVLAINAAILVATLGLGMVAAPATFAGELAFGITAGFVGGVAPLITSNIYTELHDLDDPQMQAWWKEQQYSAGDILLGGAIGAGIGAAFPIGGKLLGAVGKAANPAALVTGEVALPEGAFARALGKGSMEITIPAEGLTMKITPKGWTLTGPAGGQPNAVLGSGAWAEAGGPIAGEPFSLLHDRFPSQVVMTDKGWAMVSPKSAAPVQWGVWDDLVLPAGASPGGTSGFPIVLADDVGSGLATTGVGRGQGWPSYFGPPQLGPGPSGYGLPQLGPGPPGYAPPQLGAGPAGPVITPFRPIPQLGPGNPTTYTLKQIRNMRGRQKWMAAEDYVTELNAANPQQHFPVPTQGGDFPVTLPGGRFVDAPVPTAGGGTRALEVKAYNRWRWVEGAAERREVPLSDGIKEQINKDVALRAADPSYDPQWQFIDAPPSKALVDYLKKANILWIHYQ